MLNTKKICNVLDKDGFFIKPKVRFENMPGEQHTMFIKDPSNNFIEIKAFADQNKLFET